MAKTWGKAEPLVQEYVRGVESSALEKLPKVVHEFIGHGKSGVYILRRFEEAYYVGLASSLPNRLRKHTKDHLRGEWNRFDLYVVRNTELKYLKEIETLLIRVTRPQGNRRKKPGFAGAKNRTRGFLKLLAQHGAG
jgi:GIY-YIG catalytic domain